MHVALATVIFGSSLALLLVRPRRVPDWAAALGGGLTMVLVGLLPLGAAASALADASNVFLFSWGLASRQRWLIGPASSAWRPQLRLAWPMGASRAC
jgi:hypothetical protein